MHKLEEDSKDVFDLCGNPIQDCNDRVRSTDKGANLINEDNHQI